MPPAQRTILTPADHGLILHLDGRGFVSIAQRVNGSWQERGVPIANLAYFLKHLEPNFDSYISQNRFHSPRRRIAYLVQADALFSDLDYYLTEFGRCDPRYILDLALTLLDDANIPPPTFATSTGRGLALVWLITPIPRRALPRWRACQEVIFQVLKLLGADPNARDAARVLRLVGTRNSRSGTLVETISGVGEIWDFDILATEILPVARDAIRSKRRRRRTNLVSSKIIPPTGFSAATLWASRLDDFQKLIVHRYGTLRLPSGERDLLMQLYGVGMSYLVDSPARLRREMLTIADDICGWPERETKARLSAVFSRTEAAYRGKRVEYLGGQRDPRYRYKDATMVDMLGVTEQEMRVLGLRHLVTDGIKRERDRDRKREARQAAGGIPRETYLTNSLSRQQPWERDGVCRRTWERRRHQNTSGAPAAVASPSGCMVAEPQGVGAVGESRELLVPKEAVPGNKAGLLTVAQRRTRQLELPFGFPQEEVDQAELDAWHDGAAPAKVRRTLLRELRARDLRHRELADAVGLSRSQLTNVLRGRFGTAPPTVGALKRLIAAWGFAA